MRGCTRLILGLGVVAQFVLFACGDAPQPLDIESPDGRDDIALVGGKADGITISECHSNRILGFVNQADTDYAALRAIDVHGAASRRIPAARDGADATPGTSDDVVFADLAALDAVPYVGPAAMRALVNSVRRPCEVATGRSEVIFSPQPYDQSHLVRVVELLDAASTSIDIAMYSLRDGASIEAIHRAAQRGVSVRLILDAASRDRRDPEGTLSARFEDAGIEVRWVNKVMHHKFALIDGPRDELRLADPGTLITGSGNWSWGAATRYDENTVFLYGHSESMVQFQAEFNRMWANGRLVTWNESIEEVPWATIDPAETGDDPTLEVVFTSDNFDVRQSSRYGPTFTAVGGRQVASDRLVELIESATTSIHVASGHLRSQDIAHALIAARERNPALDIRVYLDGQEYVSWWRHNEEQDELAACRAEAGDDLDDARACGQRGLHYGYALQLAGLDVRYKYYAYRWDVRYAAQMHHKYLVIDGRILATGSYNFSDNAERDTFENVVIYDGAAFPTLVAQFEANFEALWGDGRAEGELEILRDVISSPVGDIPLVFEPMALTWDEVTELKSLIRQHCPVVDSDEYRENRTQHQSCPR